MSTHIQVFSPHYDDAVLSCGQHILDWMSDGHQVEIITVFTHFDATVLSQDSINFVANCGARDLKAFRNTRAAEDRHAMRVLGVDEYQWLSLTDGGFRVDQERPVYKTHDHLFSGSILDSKEWLDTVKGELQEVTRKDALHVVPLGVGRHADHLIVKRALEQISSRAQIRWYVDVPYYLQCANWNWTQLRALVKRKASWKWGGERRNRAVEAYKSQLSGLFAQDLWEYPECVLMNR